MTEWMVIQEGRTVGGILAGRQEDALQCHDDNKASLRLVGKMSCRPRVLMRLLFDV